MSNITFPDAVTDANGDHLLNCRSKPQDGVKVKIGALGEDVQIGAVLKISWEGFNMQDVSIPETKTSLNHFVVEADMTEGLQETISDYTHHIKPIRNGSAKVEYTINGGPPTSVSIRVHLLNSSNQTCDEVELTSK